MPGRFSLRIQGAIIRILGISLLAFLYGTITLWHVAFQRTSSQQAREDPSPTTPHPITSSAIVRFTLRRFHSPLLTVSHWFLFLWVLRCFTSPRSSSLRNSPKRKILIRRFWGQNLRAVNPDITQFATFFISAWNQAIHQVDTVARPL